MTISRMLRFAFALLVTASAIAIAGEARPDPRDEAVHSILSSFWGRAKNVHGQPIEPSSEEERTVVPVPMSIAYRALEAGQASGAAEWCGLDWEPHYFSLTKAARLQKMSDTQVAFISVLHGASQGSFIRSAQGETCSEAARAEASARLTEFQVLGLSGLSQ